MITIEINEASQNLADISPSWIKEQVKKREEKGVAVCLRIYIKKNNVDLMVSCGDCEGRSGRGRRPNRDEEATLSLWDKFGCRGAPINVGKVTAFLNQVK